MITDKEYRSHEYYEKTMYKILDNAGGTSNLSEKEKIRFEKILRKELEFFEKTEDLSGMSRVFGYLEEIEKMTEHDKKKSAEVHEEYFNWIKYKKAIERGQLPKKVRDTDCSFG